MVRRAAPTALFSAALITLAMEAFAGGSVPATEVDAVIRKSKTLASEIQGRLSAQKKTRTDVQCTSARVGRSVDKQRGGQRVGPYTCTVGDQTVEITVHRTPGAAKAARKEQSGDEGSVTWQWR